ncbi:MAG: hypothetical protein KC591_09430 [Gemmatimonadetes bacterium]|nr:hypothetical protein [Gemmatimonadota bacterium]
MPAPRFAATLFAGLLLFPRIASPETTLTIGVQGSPDTFLPPFSRSSTGADVFRWIYTDLCEFEDDGLTPKPALARAWEESDDGRVVTFHLDTAARWHDGQPVTSRDVVFTHELIADEATGSTRRGNRESIESVVAPDDSTVVFAFSQATPYRFVDARSGSVLPAHLLESVPRESLASSEYARAPIGSGPFRFSRAADDDFVELVAVRDHFRTPPRFDRLRFQVIPELTTQIVMLQRGDLDVVRKVPREDRTRLAQNVDLRFYRVPSESYQYVGWNLRNPRFQDARVREALSLALDREEICRVLDADAARPFVGPLGDHHWAFAADLARPHQDLEAAQRLLADAGWSDSDGDGWLDREGEPFSFELLTNSESQLRRDLAVLLQSAWARLGVRAEPQLFEYNTLIQTVLRREYPDAFLLGQGSPARPRLDRLFHSRSIEHDFNVTSYSSPGVDAALDAAEAARTREEALPLWQDVQRLLAADRPLLWLITVDDVYGCRADVQVEPDARDFFARLPEWRIDR